MHEHYSIYLKEHHRDNICYCQLAICHGDEIICRLLLHKGQAIRVAREMTHIINHMDEEWHPDVTPPHKH
jgi:hypothetical protein